MSILCRYNHLVPARWLNSLIVNGNADRYHNRKFVICHAHYRNIGAYDEGHIPGAISLDTNSLESSRTWNARTPQELEETLKQSGITHDTTVILYGRFSFPDNLDQFPGSSAGQLAAMRCALIMLYAGVKDVRVLNGGLQSWMDDGFEVSKEYTAPEPVSRFGISIPGHPEFLVDTPRAKEILNSPNENLVCVRSWREYIGEVSGYNYIRKKGRIPGAVFVNCGTDAYHMDNYRNVDHTTREYQELEEIWAQAGVTSGKYNSFYCGTGWRGSEAFINAWLMGWSNISVYDGGWFEWRMTKTILTKKETGIPQ